MPPRRLTRTLALMPRKEVASTSEITPGIPDTSRNEIRRQMQWTKRKCVWLLGYEASRSICEDDKGDRRLCRAHLQIQWWHTIGGWEPWDGQHHYTQGSTKGLYSHRRTNLGERSGWVCKKRSTYLKENIKTLYSLGWGQCTEKMQQKVEATNIFETMSMEGNDLTLLKVINDDDYIFQSQKYLPHSLNKSKRRFWMCV